MKTVNSLPKSVISTRRKRQKKKNSAKLENNLYIHSTENDKYLYIIMRSINNECVFYEL